MALDPNLQCLQHQRGLHRVWMLSLTSVVQELARLVTGGVAAPSAQPLEGAAQGARAASSSDALGPYKPKGPQIPMLKLRMGSATHAESGPPPDSTSSSSFGSSSSDDGDKLACRMCGSTKHHEKDCPKLTANKRRRRMVLAGVVQMVVGILVIMAQTGLAP